MEYWKLPPRVKVLEALSAIADNRIKLVSDKEAFVTSSLGDKTYHVKWDGDKGITADDNGSVYRGYLGYPSIAFLMIKGLLPYDEEIAMALKGVKWKTINEKFKKYRIVEAYVKEIAEKKGVKRDKIDNFIERVLNEIKNKKFYKILS
ncbi:MAG TPA: hypothetical protein ENF80_03620 [Thermofilum sp.]|nr:hypothetical protein [Thermofilum sp.]